MNKVSGAGNKRINEKSNFRKRPEERINMNGISDNKTMKTLARLHEAALSLLTHSKKALEKEVR